MDFQTIDLNPKSVSERREKMIEELEKKGEESSKFELIVDHSDESALKAGQVTSENLFVADFGNWTAFLEIVLSDDKELQATINKKGLSEDDEEMKDESSKEPEAKALAEIYKSKSSDSYYVIPVKKVPNSTVPELVDTITSLINATHTVCFSSVLKKMIHNYFELDDNPLGFFHSSSTPQDTIAKFSAAE